jgi:sentrin-specific protease 1
MFYLNLICKAANSCDDLNNKKAICIDTFFYANFSIIDYERIAKMTKHFNMFMFNFVLIPIYTEGKPGHWALIIIDFDCKSINYYDSIKTNSGMDCIEKTKNIIIKESFDKNKVEFSFNNWIFRKVGDLPVQNNVIDCGVFLCQYAIYTVFDRIIDFNSEEIKFFRQIMQHEIINKKLFDF